MILYLKQSLFDQPEGLYLAHGCNAQGVWGSGIAVSFKENYPNSMKEYSSFCIKNNRQSGVHLITKENVVCLITSWGYANFVDSKEKILANTRLAVESFLKEYVQRNDNKPIYSNKFNSGLFKVPWEETEAILKELTEKYNVTWTVCDPKMELE